MKAHVYDVGRAPTVPQRNAVGKRPPPKTKAPAKAGLAAWLVAALLVLSAVPLAASVVRLTKLVDVPDVHP